MDSLLLFPYDHLLVIEVISDVDLDTKLFSELVDACALCTYNTPDIFLVNVEFCGL